MKKNIVTLDLEEYNKLKDFKEAVKARKIYVDYNSFGISGYSRQTYFCTKNEVINEFTRKNKGLKDEKKALKYEISVLREQLKSKTKTIDDIKQMTCWKFYKWKQKHERNLSWKI